MIRLIINFSIIYFVLNYLSWNVIPVMIIGTLILAVIAGLAILFKEVEKQL